jgi:hypothetical protein
MDTVVPAGVVQFEAWRDAGPSNGSGKSDSGLKLELAGQIIQATKEKNGILVVAEYGSAEGAQRKGDYEFAFLYPGDLNTQALGNGQRFVVVGTTTSRRPVIVNGKPKTEPFLVADCIYLVSETTHCVAQ